ncbi:MULTISPECIES: ester cyclase [Pseudonocardia]|nr:MULTISPECIES: ester cyclase [Pseudonocardia]BBG03998.1 hypothetical protein Pdca_52070 [Pseudonocardia autotrophica]GEC27749.1 hypothetical protein PSA01_47780 [Pseudonocardia saturnea]
MSDESADIGLIRAVLRAADAGDLDGCRNTCTPTWSSPLPGAGCGRGPRDLARRSRGDGRGLSGPADHAARRCVRAAGLVALRCTLTGTHRGPFNGLEPTGRPIDVMSNDFYRIEDGRGVEGWIVTDTGTLFAQIT